LRQELHLLDRYLLIERARLGDRLRVEKQIDIGALDALVPTLILQPLVENAVKHGIEPRPAPGLIRLAVERSAQGLLLTVGDNCQRASDKSGSEPTTPGTEATVKEGIGLGNIRSRLKELYGSRAGLVLARAPAWSCAAARLAGSARRSRSLYAVRWKPARVDLHRHSRRAPCIH
jgi:two-component system LytT family sensor kinase